MVSQVGIIHYRIAKAQHEGGSPNKRLGWSVPIDSFEVPKEVLFFFWPLVVRASLAGGWWEEWVISPSSAPSVPLPPWPLFIFLSAASTEDVRVRAGVGGRGTTGIAGEEPSLWAISKARRSGVFSSKPIPSEMLVPSWLKLNWVRCRGRCEVLEASLGSSYW